VIIVTPAVGWPEPRPQHLITGDRAVQVLDSVTSTALQKAGVKLVTISASSFSTLIAQLVPEVMDGLDPDTGKLEEAVIPDRLSPAALDDIDIRGSDGKVEEQYIPARLSQTNLTALLNGAIGTVVDFDPDGTPVILAGAGVEDDLTVTGIATLGTVNMSDAHADNLTATILDVTTAEVDTQTFVAQSATPGNPAASKYKLYADNTGRLVYRRNDATVFRVGGKRIVSAWPAGSDSTIGDEAINSTTGEHRVYLGSTLGWRLATPFAVSTKTDRDAIASPYPGMEVFCSFGFAQNQIYKVDSEWHGTQNYVVAGGTVTTTGPLNDTNFHRWSTTSITDPGYDYHLHGVVALEIGVAGSLSRINVVTSVNNGGTPTQIDFWYHDGVQSGLRWVRCNTTPMTLTPLSGAQSVTVDWQSTVTNSAASSTGYQSIQRYMVVPA
jgi:hypothetical protein